MVMMHTHAKVDIKGNSAQNLEQKEMDSQTDKAIPLPPVRKLLVIINAWHYNLEIFLHG